MRTARWRSAFTPWGRRGYIGHYRQELLNARLDHKLTALAVFQPVIKISLPGL